MRSDELVSRLRLSAYIGSASEYPDQTDAVLLDELNDKLWSVFEDIVTKARSGYWLQEVLSSTTAGRKTYRIPSRAVVGGLESVEVAGSTGGIFYTLSEIAPTDTQMWEGPSAAPTQGTPTVFCVLGDQLALYNTPAAVLPMRLRYYVRPSRLVTQQSFTTGAFVQRGLITATSVPGVNPVTLTVNVVPFDMDLAVPAAITTAVQRIDVVHPNGWHELAVVGSTQTLAGAVFTLPNGTDISRVEVGDYVRAAEQTDWPCLPADFHRALADVAAVKVAVELGLREKNDDLASNVENDLIRFRSLLLPRVKSEPKTTPVFLASRGGW